MSALTDLIGKELGPTEWFEVTQERIDQFAEATDDPQWIHTDPVRAADGPFGTTVAHGFLTLSLCVPLMTQTLALTGYSMGVNYASARGLPSRRSRRSRVASRRSCSAPSSARAGRSRSASPSSS